MKAMEKEINIKKIKSREKKLSIIPSFILPLIFAFLFFMIFSNNKTIMAINTCVAISAFYPLFIIALYVKQAKLTDFSPMHGDYFFKTKGYEKTVIRFEKLERLLIWYAIFFIASTTMLAILLYGLGLLEIKNPELVNDPNFIKVKDLFIIWDIIPAVMVYTMLIFRFRMRQFHDFEFHYALGCLRIVKVMSGFTEEEKLGYFIKGIKHYDYFLQKILNLRINKMSQIYTKIALSDLETRSKLLADIIEQMDETSKTKLVGYFVKSLSISDTATFFVSYTFVDRIKSWIPLIAIVIASIGLITQIFKIFHS